MKKTILALIFFASATVSFAQNFSQEYYNLTSKADSLYRKLDYKKSSIAYSGAFKINGGKALTNDRYNAACSWALAGYSDSSFVYLYILATKANYSYYSSIVTDSDLRSLHNDNRWKPLLEIIKQNKITLNGKSNQRCLEDKNIVTADGVKKKSGPEINSYNLNLNIDVKARKISVSGYLDIDFHNHDSITLILWRRTKINKIEYKNKNVLYTFDTVSTSPIIYIPDGKKLTIINPTKRIGKHPVFLNYECDMRSVSGWGKSFTEDWIEIGFYCAWYPVHVESKNTVSKINVSIDDGYKVSGSGIVTRKGNYWEMVHKWPITDNIIIASKDLKSKTIQDGIIKIETVYTTFPESDIDSVLVTCKDVLSFYKKIYGLQDSSYMKFVICPTQGGGGYGRRNYFSLKASNFSAYLVSGVAHEMAHSWWNKADVTTWQDWINEAFAEYSDLLYMRKKFGLDVFNDYIEAYRVNISKSCPIWGIDRSTPEAYSALYEKGSLILYDLEQQLGTERFYNFLKIVLRRNVKTTNEFLLVVEQELGINTRNWFEMRLKAKNDDK